MKKNGKKITENRNKNIAGEKKNYLLFLAFCIMFLFFGGVAIFMLINKLNEQVEWNKIQQKAQPVIESNDLNASNQINSVSENTEEPEMPEAAESDIYSKWMPENIPQKEIDWEYLTSKNKDVYAWVFVPNTGIDYPVLQHPTEESFYLSRGLDKKETTAGSIYTDYLNNKDFSDKLTVLYGHNMRNGSMFGNLHMFEDADFFSENEYFYIYTKEKIFCYKIFAVYEFSNAHLLYNFNLEDDVSYQNYIDQIYTNQSACSHFDQQIEVNEKSKIATLSTCISGKKNQRYLVQGVLLNE